MKTIIDHKIRQKMGITCDEYVVLESLVKYEVSGRKTSVDFESIGFNDDKIFRVVYPLSKTKLVDEEVDVDGNSNFKATKKAIAFFKPDHSMLIAEIVTFLNNESGAKFKVDTKPTKDAISARIKEGYTYEDFVKVIKFKCKTWKGTDQEQYLRPITLFGNKFEGYLQAANNSLPKEPENPKMKGMIM